MAKAQTVKVPVTARTRTGTDGQGKPIWEEKTVEFDCPTFDEGLANLIAHVGSSKEVFRDWYEKTFKIEKQAAVRRMIEREAAGEETDEGNGKDASVLKQLGL